MTRHFPVTVRVDGDDTKLTDQQVIDKINNQLDGAAFMVDGRSDASPFTLQPLAMAQFVVQQPPRRIEYLPPAKPAVRKRVKKARTKR